MEIRKAPRLIQNVVIYTVVISADNPDGRLLPGMTAEVRIVVAERRDVLKVPNAALRFRPPKSTETNFTPAAGAERHIRRGRLWFQNEDGAIYSVTVELGYNNDSATEIASGNVDAGQRVAVGFQSSPRVGGLFGLQWSF